MKLLGVLLVVVAVSATLTSVDGSRQRRSLSSKLAGLAKKIGMSEETIHRIGEKKHKLEKMISSFADKMHKKLEKMGVGNVEEKVEPTHEDKKLPHQPSPDDPHVEEENVIDGDEMLTEDQVNERIEEEKSLEKEEEKQLSSRRKRQFQTNPAYYWQKDLDFYIDPAMSREITAWTREGMQWINDNTCLTVREARSKSRARKPFVTFQAGGWCNSFVGKSWVNRDGEQVLNMNKACADVGTVIHEFSHALGFQHEQSRSDRDNYVRIAMNNVQGDAKYNFNKEKTDNFKWPYIYGSLMAYGAQAFSRGNGAITIVTDDKRYQRTLGWRDGSFADARRINTAYKCIDDCKRGATCKNGGFRHPKNCNVCKCPEPFQGNDCGQMHSAVDPTGRNRGCGGVIQLNSNEQNRNIKFNVKARGSKQYHYCYYEIKAPNNQRVKLQWNKQRGDYMPCVSGCNWGFIELNPGVKQRDGTRDYGLPGFRDCCHEQLDPTPVVSDTNSVMVTVMAKESELTIHVSASAIGGGGGGNTGGNGNNNGGGGGGGNRVTTQAPQNSYQQYLACHKQCTDTYSRGGQSYQWVLNCVAKCESKYF